MSTMCPTFVSGRYNWGRSRQLPKIACSARSFFCVSIAKETPSVEDREAAFTQRAPSMRLPFLDPPQDEIVAVATDLIMRFGLQAHDEALHLVEVAAQMRAVRNRHLYILAAREIEKSFAEARSR